MSNYYFDRFKHQINKLGGEVLEKEWKGIRVKHKVRCHNGHITYPCPGNVNSGQNICGQCRDEKWAAERSQTAWDRFCAQVINRGGTVLEKEWRGTGMPHMIQCNQNHIEFPRPNAINAGQGICRTCGIQRRSKALSDNCMPLFISRLEELGLECLDNEWNGRHHHYNIECSLGHISYINAHNLMNYHSGCHECAGKVHDVVYVLRSYDSRSIKFGITSNKGKIRLQEHAQDGYVFTECIYYDLADKLADRIERAIIRALESAEYKPIHGREYFNIECLPIVLQVIERMLDDV